MKACLLLLTLALALGSFTVQGSPATCTGFYSVGNDPTHGLGPGGGQSAGCEQIDVQFLNFDSSGNPSNNNVGATFSGTDLPSGISAGFSSAQWVVNPGSISSSVSYTAQVDPAFPSDFFTTLTLAVGHASLGAGTSPSDVVTIQEDFCVGDATFDCGSQDANFGQVEYSLVTAGVEGFACYNAGATGASAPCATPVLQLGGPLTITIPAAQLIGIQDIVHLSSIDAQSELTQFTSTLSEVVPEPGTLALFAASLAVFLLLRRKDSLRAQ